MSKDILIVTDNPITQTVYAKSNNVEYILRKYSKELNELNAFVEGAETDRIILYRFLKAFKFDMLTVKKRLASTLEWRNEVDYANVRQQVETMTIDQFPHAKLIEKYLPEFFSYSFDRDGNVVSLTCPGRILPNELAAHVTIEQVLEHQTYHMAYVSSILRKQTKKTGVITRVTRIIDLDGIGRKHVANSMIKYLRASLVAAQANFVEFMAHALIINAPATFTVAWALIKPILHERTVRKVIITGGQYSDLLDEYIAPENLPQFLGGSCDKKFEFHDHEEGFEVVYVECSGQYTRDIVIEQPNTYVEWQFRTGDYDIGFEVNFLKPGSEASTLDSGMNLSNADDSNECCIQVLPPERVMSHKHTIIGEYQAQNIGVVQLLFDNSYSRWTAKELHLRVDVSKL